MLTDATWIGQTCRSNTCTSDHLNIVNFVGANMNSFAHLRLFQGITQMSYSCTRVAGDIYSDLDQKLARSWFIAWHLNIWKHTESLEDMKQTSKSEVSLFYMWIWSCKKRFVLHTFVFVERSKWTWSMAIKHMILSHWC